MFSPKRARENAARCGASSPQRTPARSASSRRRGRSSSSKRKRRRTGSDSARSSSWDAVTRASARSSSVASVPNSGLTSRSERSASRTRSRWPGCAVGLAVARPEGRRDERGERLDVRAQDDDVARLERRVGAQDAEDRLAQDLDLAVRTVAAVHADAAVVDRGAGRGRAVVAQVVLQLGEQRGRRRGRRVVPVGARGASRAGQAQLQLADVAPEAREQGVRHGLRARVVGAAAALPALEARPERGRGVGQPEVDVVVDGEGVEDGELGVRQAGRPRRARGAPGTRPAGTRTSATVSAGLTVATRARRRRHSSGCQRRSSGAAVSSSPPPRRGPARAGGRRSG